MSLDPGLDAYLRTNRDFMAAAVARAIDSLGLARSADVLDADTGAGSALPMLARGREQRFGHRCRP